MVYCTAIYSRTKETVIYSNGNMGKFEKDIVI